MIRTPPRRAAYLIRTRHSRSLDGDSARYDPGMLIEATAAELRAIERQQGPGLPHYRRIDASRAHDWVRRGYTHETGLWNDGGRIRYATGEVDGAAGRY